VKTENMQVGIDGPPREDDRDDRRSTAGVSEVVRNRALLRSPTRIDRIEVRQSRHLAWRGLRRTGVKNRWT
jgi:hypothetical protein